MAALTLPPGDYCARTWQLHLDWRVPIPLVSQAQPPEGAAAPDEDAALLRQRQRVCAAASRLQYPVRTALHRCRAEILGMALNGGKKDVMNKGMTVNITGRDTGGTASVRSSHGPLKRAAESYSLHTSHRELHLSVGRAKMQRCMIDADHDGHPLLPGRCSTDSVSPVIGHALDPCRPQLT